MDRRIKQGKTLRKVRKIEEQTKAQETHRAKTELDEAAKECSDREQQLADLDMAVNAKVQDGMSMAEFMRFQDLREIHEGAVHKAQREERHALQQLDECKGELLAASKLRRAAEKWLDTSVERWQQEKRRAQQKSSDDATCVRVANKQ
jgi:flagellar export protein FliJ